MRISNCYLLYISGCNIFNTGPTYTKTKLSCQLTLLVRAENWHLTLYIYQKRELFQLAKTSLYWLGQKYFKIQVQNYRALINSQGCPCMDLKLDKTGTASAIKKKIHNQSSSIFIKRVSNTPGTCSPLGCLSALPPYLYVILSNLNMYSQRLLTHF